MVVSEMRNVEELIVERLFEIDEMAKRVEAIELRIWRAIGRTAADWAKKQGGWSCEHDDEAVRVGPSTWKDEGEFRTSFEIDWGPDDTGEGVGDEPYFDLSRYCGVGTGRLCLWLYTQGIGSRTWKPLAVAAADEFYRKGFQLSPKAELYTDCTIEQQALAGALAEDDLTAVLQPIRDALERAAALRPVVERTLKKARSA